MILTQHRPQYYLYTTTSISNEIAAILQRNGTRWFWFFFAKSCQTNFKTKHGERLLFYILLFDFIELDLEHP